MLTDELLLAKLWEDSVIGLAVIDKTGVFLRVNPALCRFLERTESELIGTTFKDVTHPQDYEADWKMVQLLLAGQGEMYDMVKRYLPKLEGVEWAYLRVSALRNRNGDFLAFLSQVSPTDREESQPEQVSTRGWISWGTVKAAMPTVVLVAGTIGVIIAYILKQLYGIEVPNEK